MALGASAPPAVSIRLATAGEQPLIEGLMQFYIYDFSELEPPGSTQLDFNAQGRFDPYPSLADYWRTDGQRPLLIHVAGVLAGFALINRRSHRDDGEIANNVAEYFVARKHRRDGVGAAALRQILALYPGYWEAAVVERNRAAQAFWPRAIAAAGNVSDIVRHEGDGEHWTGPIWSFVAG